MKNLVLPLFAIASLVGQVAADEFQNSSVIDPAHVLRIPVALRQWYRNPDGSCVLCSMGMCGVEQNVPEASTLLWDTLYGTKERGGAWPGRVADIAKKRSLKIYNVTGSNTWDWMRWACATGRPCAIGAGGSHFQTLAGYEPTSKTWFVCNNNSPQKIDEYTDDGFRRLHLASGQWCVILDYPATSAIPAYSKWW